MVTISGPRVKGKRPAIRYAAKFVISSSKGKVEKGILVVVRARTRHPKRLTA